LLAAEGEYDAEHVIRKKARALVARETVRGWTGPPYDPLILASLMGIRAREGSPDMTHDALIRPLTDRHLEIVWSPTPPATRRRFSICHEIVHTFFPDAYEIAHYRHERAKRDPDQELESLCDLGASELLLPASSFGPDLDAHGVSLATMDLLRERYEASREATLLRIASLADEPLAVAILCFRHKPVEQRKLGQGSFDFAPGPRPKLRVDLMTASAAFPTAVLPKHKSVPDDSIAYRVLENDGEGNRSAVETWSAAHRLPPCNIEVLSIPPDGTGARRVAALLLPA
jgi:hypothetical protein